jgi:hypothetical protein
MPLFLPENPLPPSNEPTTMLVVPPYDVQWNRPIFRAPAISLPSAAQIWSEIPFTAQFVGKIKEYPTTATAR